MGGILSQPISSQLLQRVGSKSFRVGSSEMQGWRLNMEDTHTIELSVSDKHKDTSFFGVYDGHAGDQASIYLAEYLYKRIGDLDSFDEDTLIEHVQAFDKEFMETKVEDREHGSTCCFALVTPKEENKVWDITVSNVGDSRAILVRQDGTCVSLTEDHKPENDEERYRIMQAGGSVSSNRVDGQLAMSRAIGDYNYKDQPDLLPHQQKVTAVPDITTESAQAGDVLLLCCDGIVEQLTNEQVAEFVHAHVQAQLNGTKPPHFGPPGMEAEAEEGEEGKAEGEEGAKGELDPATIVQGLLKYSLQAGSKDNHSAMLICFGTDGENYGAKDEFVAGPLRPYQHDKEFYKAYIADAKKHGYEGDELVAMAAKTEESMPELKNLPTQAPADDEDEDGENPLLSFQQQVLGLVGQGDATTKERLLALTAMFNGMPMNLGGGGGFTIMDDGDSSEEEEEGAQIEEISDEADKVDN